MKVGLRPEQQVDRDTMTGKKKKRTANIWFPREYSEQVHNLFFIININIRLIYVYFN
jgi:hypothetical protein